MPKHEEEPLVRLARDEFTSRRRELDAHPEAVTASSRIDVTDAYGNVTTWVTDLYRLEGAVTAFLQRGAPDGYIRMVIPPQVTATIARHQAGLVTKHRRKVARRMVSEARALSGEPDTAPKRKRRR